MNEIWAQIIAGVAGIGSAVAVKLVEHALKQRLTGRRSPELVPDPTAEEADEA